MLCRSVPGEMMSKTVILFGRFVGVANYHSNVMLDIVQCEMCILHMKCGKLVRFPY